MNSEYLYDPATASVTLQSDGLTRVFGTAKRPIAAVNDVKFSFRKGEITSIVGESGSGKTTLMRLLMGLLRPSKGEILYKSRPVDLKSPGKRREYWREVQAIFQDPFASFNQFFRIHRIFDDCLKFKGLSLSKDEKAERIRKVFEFVNLKYEELRNKYPFELSGGQMQRMMIARVFLLEPDVLIADEPTSMIDACSRSTILEMLMRLRAANDMTIIFITHDLGLAYYISNTIHIMEKGAFVESGDAERVIRSPRSAYTKHLLSDVPKLHDDWIL